MERRLLTVATVFAAAVLGAATTLGQTAALGALVLALGFCGLAALGAERFGILALAGAFATAPMYRGIGEIGPATPTDLLLFVGLVMLLPVVFQRHWSDVPTGFVMAVGALMVLGLLALTRAAAPVTSLVFLVQWLLVFAALPIFLVMWRPQRRIIDLLLGSFLVGQLASTGYGLLTGAGADGRLRGFSHHPNDFGLAAAISVAIVFYLTPHFKELGARALLFGVVGINLVGLVMSGSRGATLALALVILLVPVVERTGAAAFSVGLSGALGLALLPFMVNIGGAGGSLSRLSGDATAEHSDTLRSEALSEGWQRFLHSPFLGSGLDAQVGEYHNLFLEVAVAFGVFGVFAYLVACWAFAAPVFSNHPLRRLGYLPWLFLVVGITFPGIVDRTIAIPMAMAMLAAVPPYGEEEGAPDAASEVGDSATGGRATPRKAAAS